MASQIRKIMVTASELDLDFAEYRVSLTNYLKAKTGLKAISPDVIFRLGQIMAMRYPSVLANMHKNLPDNERVEPVHKRCKLSAVLVRDIRCAHDTGESIRSLARSYEISVSTVWKIVNERTWKNLN